MTLFRTKGNLLNMAEAGEFDVILHGCNCFNNMGGGIAREIRERYPMAAKADSETVSGSHNKLGSISVADTGSFIIVNGYTQYEASSDADVFEYTAFQFILEKMTFAYGKKRIGLPYIGMGLAGGDKEVILAMIERFAHSVTECGGSVTLVEFN